MRLWLLNTFDLLPLTLIIVGGLLALALLGSVLTRRRFPSVLEGKYNHMVGSLMQFIGAIYGIMFAFMIIAVWTQLEDARSTTTEEAISIAQVVRDSEAFPPEQQARMKAAISSYVHGVVDRQWPQMRAGRVDFSLTAADLGSLYQSLQTYQPVTEAEKVFYSRATESLENVARQRRARLLAAEQGIPGVLLILVYSGVLIIPLTYLYGLDNQKVQLVFVGSVALLIGLSLLLLLLLDYPFAGQVNVSPAPFKEGVLQQFW